MIVLQNTIREQAGIYGIIPLPQAIWNEFWLCYCERSGYCSLVISREVFFVSKGHRKPETYRANLCD